ncbi:MAG: WG repeat-containing protein [Bacteroidota bacterium]
MRTYYSPLYSLLLVVTFNHGCNTSELSDIDRRNHYFVFVQNNHSGLIDLNANVVIPAEYDYISPLSTNLDSFRIYDGTNSFYAKISKLCKGDCSILFADTIDIGRFWTDQTYASKSECDPPGSLN